MSTGVRGKKSVALSNTTLAATDHDLHHKGSLTPSVYMQCDVLESIDKTFLQRKSHCDSQRFSVSVIKPNETCYNPT